MKPQDIETRNLRVGQNVKVWDTNECIAQEMVYIGHVMAKGQRFATVSNYRWNKNIEKNKKFKNTQIVWFDNLKVC